MSEINESIPCFDCDEGKLVTVFEDFSVRLPDGQSLTVPQLEIRRCDSCGEESLPAASSRAVEAAIDQFQETVPPETIQQFLEQFGLTQSEAAEALGLGAKTIHRWAKGTQRVSRSMGFFIRAMMAHPESFEWIRDRKWRAQRDKDIPPKPQGSYWGQTEQIRFAAIYGRMRPAAPPSTTASFNAARGLLGAVHQ